MIKKLLITEFNFDDVYDKVNEIVDSVNKLEQGMKKVVWKKK